MSRDQMTTPAVRLSKHCRKRRLGRRHIERMGNRMGAEPPGPARRTHRPACRDSRQRRVPERPPGGTKPELAGMRT